MEYYIEANPVIFWATIGQVAGTLIMLTAYVLKKRIIIALSAMLAIISSILLSDAVMACGLIIAIMVACLSGTKKAKKNRSSSDR